MRKARQTPSCSARPFAGKRANWPCLSQLALAARAMRFSGRISLAATASTPSDRAPVLLRGKWATTHWMSRPMLAAFGCEPEAERVVVDGKPGTDAARCWGDHTAPLITSSI